MTKQLHTFNAKSVSPLAQKPSHSLVKMSTMIVLGMLLAGCQSLPFGGSNQQAPVGRFEKVLVPPVSTSTPSQSGNAAVTAAPPGGTTNGPVDLRPSSSQDATAASSPRRFDNLVPDRNSEAMRYEVSAGDILEIAVFPIDELKRRVEVDSAGRVNLPLIGEVRVEGKSTLEIARTLAAQYRGGFVRDPNVSVLVVEKVNQRYTVAGLVRTPGTFPIESNQTLLSALAKSGGLAESADFRNVILRRVVSGATISVPLNVRAVEAGLAPDPRIFAGDIIIAASTGSRISVAGTVERPGLFPITGPVTITQAVALAGGVQRGSNPANIRLFRPVGDTVQTYTYGRYDLESGRIADPQLMPGDRVVVEQRDSKVLVSGAVVQSGSYSWTPGLKLSAAIALARGLNVLADTKQVLILREINGETKAARFDIIEIQKGAAEDPLLLDGDQVFVSTNTTREAILTWAPLASFLNVFAVLAR
jgi:polysaccharide biosynthesis/export protein